MQQFSSSWSGRPARPRTQHDCHHDTKVKPEAATAVMDLLMMGGRTPKTCWAVNKRQDNKLENCCNWLVIYLKSSLILTGSPSCHYVLPCFEPHTFRPILKAMNELKVIHLFKIHVFWIITQSVSRILRS